MRRNSTLYDYKPRLEWTDGMMTKRLKKRKKILLFISTVIVICIITVGILTFTETSPKHQTVSSTLELGKKGNSQISRVLELTHLNEVKSNSTQELLSKKEVKLSLTNEAPSLELKQNNVSAPKKPDLPFEPKLALMERQQDPTGPQLNSNTKKETAEILTPKKKWKTIIVKDGDNLSLIFSRLAISKNDLYEILSLGEGTQSLKHLKPGQVLRLKLNDSKVEELVHESDLTHTLRVKKTDNQFETEIIEEKPDIKIATSTGQIQDSLFLSGQKAGLSDNVIMQMFDIFGWDIDFVLDIRENDQFRVIYEELYKNDKKIKDGKILAAEFINQGKVLKAVHYVGSDEQPGYYSEQGKSMKKAFLRTPVNFTRISSHFNLSRKHPVLNKIRAHKGVDYAAPLGTPVKSTGNGKVLFVGTKNGYGNTVIVQHGGKYTTLYAHLSRFSRGLKKSKRVEQGQTIAYVGKTGLATGPHLHYEFRVSGVHRNPLTVDLPKSLPLPEQYMNDFIQKTKPLLSKLASLTDGSIETRQVTRVEKANPAQQKTAEKIDIAINNHDYTVEALTN